MIELPFRELWCVDFEYGQDDRGRPVPVCMVARAFKSGQIIRMWRDELITLRRAPFDVGPDVAMVAYAAWAELGCFLELGWPLPANVIDLYAEHRVETNGKKLLVKNDLLGALTIRGLAHIDAAEKEAMQQLAMELAHRPATEAEKHALPDYCETDANALIALLPVMAPTIDWPRALLRGRYMGAVARMQQAGVPIDTTRLRCLEGNWEAVKKHLVDRVDRDFGVYDDKCRFGHAQFGALLQKHNIPWQRTPSGLMKMDKDTWDEQALMFPQLQPLREVVATLTQLRSIKLPVGSDDRNRCLLSPFVAVTGRNAPSASKFVFGPARWIRGLIRPQEGHAVAYIDWRAQEVGLAAAKSGDERMIADFASRDFHIAFAKSAKLVPDDATKASHGDIRDICKTVVFGIFYGMSIETMAFRVGISKIEASEMLRLFKETYPRFWRWMEDTVNTALFSGTMHTMYGWRRHIGQDYNYRSLMNWPIQSHGAEMMRIAAIAATEADIEVCAPLHDAFLISAPLDRIDEDAAAMGEFMMKASRFVTGGLNVPVETEIVRWPNRYMDPRGLGVWNTVMGILTDLGVDLDGGRPGAH
jgi:hypothetical protein